MQASYFGFTIKEVPARCRYFEEASSVGFKTGAVYGLKTLWAGVRLVLAPGRAVCPRASSGRERTSPDGGSAARNQLDDR